MAEQTENINTDNDDATESEHGTQKRIMSGIEFPYADLETAAELAIQLQKNAGGESEDAELAAWLNQSANGGTYRSRRSAARMFGLIDVSQSKVTLTPLGRDLVDPSKQRNARAEAFLKPQLYSAMYEKCKGQVLPPPSAVERMMVQLNVSPKQKERARQAFMKSAIHAGFIDPNSSRFIKPGNGVSLPPPPDMETPNKPLNGSGGGGDGTTLDLDPLLMALLQKIPPKSDGWPSSKRVRWFRTFAMNVSQVYDEEGEPVELDIKEVKEDSTSPTS